jgi:hypothetical protein
MLNVAVKAVLFGGAVEIAFLEFAVRLIPSHGVRLGLAFAVAMAGQSVLSALLGFLGLASEHAKIVAKIEFKHPRIEVPFQWDLERALWTSRIIIWYGVSLISVPLLFVLDRVVLSTILEGIGTIPLLFVLIAWNIAGLASLGLGPTESGWRYNAVPFATLVGLLIAALLIYKFPGGALVDLPCGFYATLGLTALAQMIARMEDVKDRSESRFREQSREQTLSALQRAPSCYAV